MLEAKLYRLIQLMAKMPDPKELVLPIKAAPIMVAGSSVSEGLPFHFDQVLDYYGTASADPRGVRTREGVQVWAGAWAHAWWVAADREGPEPVGDMVGVLLARLAWARAFFPALGEFESELDEVVRQVERVSGLTPIPTGRACPSCGEGLVRRLSHGGVEDQLTCIDCGARFEPEGLMLLQRLRLQRRAEEEDVWLPRRKVAVLLGVTTHRLRVWISRGKLVENEEGCLNVRQAAGLLLDVSRKK